MAAKHFKTGEPLAERDGSDGGYRPKHGRATARPQSAHDEMRGTTPKPKSQVEGEPRGSSTNRMGTGDPATPAATIRSGRGTGWYYGERKPSGEESGTQATPAGTNGLEASHEEKASRASGSPRRGRVLAACLGGACVVAVVAGLGIWSSRRGGGNAPAVNQSATQQVEQQADASAAAPDEGDSSEEQNATGSESEQPEAAPQVSTASDVASMLTSLTRNGADCSLPTDGVEVDVRDGWVLVAYQSADDAQGTISRMTAAAVALAQDLSSTQLSDSSTAQGGVSAVPATSTPAAITASDAGTAFAGVQVVALGEGRYVIGSLSLTSADGLEGAGEVRILSAASSYAVEGPAYRYSGLASQNVAQSRGDAPTLLTGERIVMRMSVPQAAQATGSAAAGSGSVSGTGNRTSSSSASTSTSTSRSSSGGSSARNGSASGSGSRATGSSASTRRNVTQSGRGQTGSTSTSGGATGGSSYATGGTGGYAGAGDRGYAGTGSGTGTAATSVRGQGGQAPQS